MKTLLFIYFLHIFKKNYSVFFGETQPPLWHFICASVPGVIIGNMPGISCGLDNGVKAGNTLIKQKDAVSLCLGESSHMKKTQEQQPRWYNVDLMFTLYSPDLTRGCNQPSTHQKFHPPSSGDIPSHH